MLRATLRVQVGQYLSRSSNPCRTVLRHETKRYQSSHSGGSGGRGGTVLFTLGTITVATGGALVYAKYDPSFRKLLQDNIPYSEEAIRKTSEFIDMATAFVGGGSVEESSPKLPIELKSPPPKAPTISPTPVVKPPPKPVVEAKPAAPKTVSPPKEEAVTPAPVEKVTKLPEASVKQLSERLRSLENTSSAAIAVHKEALQKVSLLGQELSSYTTAGVDLGELGALIKTQVNAEKASNSATEAAETARSMLAAVKKELEVSGNMEEVHKQTVAKLETQLKEAEALLHHTQSSLQPSEALRTQLQWAQDILQEELGSTWEIHQKKSADLLMLDIALRFEQCRAQVKKSESSEPGNVDEVLDLMRREHQAEMKRVREQEEKRTERTVQQQALIFAEDKQRALLTQQGTYNEMLSKFMDQQLQVHTSHLGLTIDMLKKTHKNLSDRESNILHSAEILTMARNCDSLLQCLYTNPFPALDWTHQKRAIDAHVRDVKQAFSGKYQDEFVDTALGMLPSDVISRGVFTEPALRTRFHNMERVARRVAMISEETVSLQALILSYIRSMMLRVPVFPIREEEIAGEPCDLVQLDNNALLDRARYFTDQGDIIQAMRYLNLLQGPSLFVASGWLEEARLLLEVQQIANSLSAYASLLVLKNIASEVQK